MKKTTITLFVLCLQALSFAQAQIPSALSARLDFVLDSVCAKYRIKGTTAAILIPGAGTWKKTNGFSYDGDVITPDMAMCIGSNTKTFIAAMLLKMQEEHLIDLDDSIGKWIHNQPYISGQITIRQALNHTSGLFSYTENGQLNDSLLQNPSKIWTPEDILGLVKAPLFSAGQSWSYSNTNYIVAGIIIRDVLGKPVNVSIREKLLAPAQLNHTYFYGLDVFSDPMPHAWSVDFAAGAMVDMNVMLSGIVDQLFSVASTAGSMVSTAEDNVQFWHKLISGQLISAASLDEMRTYIPIGTAPGGFKEGYGLGIFRYQNYMNHHTIFSHGGTYFGFIHENMVDSVNGTTIAVTTNQDSIENGVLLDNVIRALHKVTLDMPVTGVEDMASVASRIHVYPNPANDVVHIKIDHVGENMQAGIYDLAGKKVAEQDMVDGETTCAVAALNPGFYILRINDQAGNVVYAQKLLVND